MMERMNMVKKKDKDIYGEDTFIKKKFKPKPTTQTEMRECKMKLSRADLFQNVTAGNKMFDFGKQFELNGNNMLVGTVCVYSENSKSFNITNSLKQHILVSLIIEHDELKKSNPLSQVMECDNSIIKRCRSSHQAALQDLM
jgi:hypothetical protein